MSLPKHNPLMRLFYVGLVLLMFVFMVMVIRVYWPHDSQINQHEVYSNKADDVQTERTSSANLSNVGYINISEKGKVGALNKEQGISGKTQKNKVFRRPKLSVSGIEGTLNLNASIKTQLETLWGDFYKLDTQRHLPGLSRSNKVYLIYKSFDHQRQSIEVLIGYQYSLKQTSSVVSSIQLPKGKYLLRDSVLATWDDPEDLPLKYQLDYEVFEVDEYFNVSHQRAFLSTYDGAY